RLICWKKIRPVRLWTPSKAGYLLHLAYALWLRENQIITRHIRAARTNAMPLITKVRRGHGSWALLLKRGSEFAEKRRRSVRKPGLVLLRRSFIIWMKPAWAISLN